MNVDKKKNHKLTFSTSKKNRKSLPCSSRELAWSISSDIAR